MPKKISENVYGCSFCKEQFSGEGCLTKAMAHEQDHNLIYFPMTKEELHAILLFFFTREDRVIKPELFERLQNYARKSQ
jgi:hypothetical protein